jgi:hypothetical protein
MAIAPRLAGRGAFESAVGILASAARNQMLVAMPLKKFGKWNFW